MVPVRSEAVGHRTETVVALFAALEDDRARLVFQVDPSGELTGKWITVELSAGEPVLAPLAAEGDTRVFALVTLQQVERDRIP